MWNNFCAVVEDLFWFAFGVPRDNAIVVYGQNQIERRETLGLSSGQFIPLPSSPVYLAAPTAPTLLPATVAFDTATAHSTSPVAIKNIPVPPSKLPTVDHESEAASAILHAPVVMYVSNADGTACVQTPMIDFDAVIETLPFGTAVTVIGYQGRFASVNRSNITGWVLKDDITPQKKEVWPPFVSGVVYDAGHPDTIKTRLLISDMFSAGALTLPLQAGEYIAVRLKSEHRSIPWSRKRPRRAGSWATLLRDVSGIHSGVTPKTDSIMEWQTDEGEGRLGYVEAVAPDLTITIGVVGEGEAGRFTVKTMSEEIWRELRPVFIEVA